jgi:transcriptional regulator GlxA family with amidase domain
MSPFRRVVAYVPPAAAGLGLGMVSAVFRPREGMTCFDFALCSERPGPVPTDLGIPVLVEHGLDLMSRADLVLVLPGENPAADPPEPTLKALQHVHRRGATVAAHCLGVFLPAAAGLLDGLEVTTHWQHADALAALHPELSVRPESLYIDNGDLVTGAGAAAGIDMYLHLVRREHGAALANAIARVLVVPPHRDGGQQQYISAPVPADGDTSRLADVIAWARTNLHQPLTIESLTARALMSRRSFIRHFKAATGATPHAWLLTQRLNLAEELLETTDLPIEQIAERVGYSSAAVLRQQFTLRRGIAPRDYRRTFGHTPAAGVSN